MPDKIMLIDGNSLLFRAFYALPPLKTSEGVYTNAVYGFLTMLRRLLAEKDPSYCLVAFDKSRSSFRSQLYDAYKGTRGETPDELVGQFTLIRSVLKGLRIPYLEKDGYEADDLIGTLALQAENHGLETVIVTGDKDALQLVSPTVHVELTRRGISETELFDEAALAAKYGVSSSQMIDVKALMGDSSDNIPGVPGIGEKTALKLIRQYGSLDNVYEHLEELGTTKVRRNLETYRDQAYLSRQLSLIVRDVDLDCELESMRRQSPDRELLIPLYERLEFKAFLTELSALPGKAIQDSAVINIIDVENKEQLPGLVAAWKGFEEMAFLLGSDNPHPMKGIITSLHVNMGGQLYRVPLAAHSQWLELLRDWLEDPRAVKITHDFKSARVLLLRLGINLQGIASDTMLLDYVNCPGENIEDLSGLLEKRLGIACPGGDPGALVNRLPELALFLREKLGPELQRLHDDLEIPVAMMLADMEYAGFKVDGGILKQISTELQARLKHDESVIHDLAGSSFNINSPQQLGKVLFEELGLPVVKKTKTGYGTGAEILEKLEDQHPIIPYIQDYRLLAKLKSTYADALAELVDPGTGRIHTIFKQAVTATGRLSSVEPNLQNIPIKMEEGRRLRRAFVAPGDDWLIMACDYSQIDLRCLAHISGDEILIESFVHGIDIHSRTAAEMFGVALDQVDETLRRRAKAVNFGIIYGISDFGLSRQTGVSRKEAASYIEAYLATYPGVRKYMEDIVAFGQQHGYVETILKRRRYLPDLNSKNKMAQSFARRMALNTPIQGSSADIIKLAMLKYGQQATGMGLRSRLLLQVHDELVFEVHRSELEQLSTLVSDCMVHAFPLAVPLSISTKTGPNWYDMR